jgi:methionyl-tRNA formyltransferase
MRALFFGTPQFAVPCLDALASIADVVGVVCQPDKPKGRGMQLGAPPVKECALRHGFEVVQPTKIKTPEFAEWVRSKNADVALVVAYGRILPQAVLEGPRKGCVNVHASLLPRHRGAAPILWAIALGDPETGVSLMQLDLGMDTGPVIATLRTPIVPDETTGELTVRLASLGATIVTQSLAPFVRGELSPVPQDDSGATHARMLDKKDGLVDFSKSAKAIHDHVRAMSPWPSAFADLIQASGARRTIKIHKVVPRPDVAHGKDAGVVLVADKSRVLVAAGAGAVELATVQLEGKKPMSGADWALGRGVATGDRFAPDSSFGAETA